MLTKEQRELISELDSVDMEKFYRTLLQRLGINRHYAPHLQVQRILTAPPTLIKLTFLEFLGKELDSISYPDPKETE